MNGSVCSIRAPWAALLVVVVATSGCTSAISTAYLRDTFWDLSDHAAEEEPKEAADAVAGEAAAEGSDTAAADAERREAAIDEAVARLTKIGALDDAARGTLIETLQGTQQEDWPVVVEAFASSLAATTPHPAAILEDESDAPQAPVAVIAAAHTVAKADLDGAAVVPPPAPEPLAPPAEAEPAALSPAPASPDVAGSSVPSAPEPAVPAQPAVASSAPVLAVRNACFATRVQAWGVVDRFPEARFRPGQELIVYFELDHLSSGRSAAGHTTCIDAALALVAADGTTIRDWSFEPIAETCASQRHDYFARYVIRLPEAAPLGPCRLDVVVSDTLAGTKARTSLPLEIVAESR